MYPRNNLNYAENFLHMLFGVPCEEYQVNPVLAKALATLDVLSQGRIDIGIGTGWNAIEYRFRVGGCNTFAVDRAGDIVVAGDNTNPAVGGKPVLEQLLTNSGDDGFKLAIGVTPAAAPHCRPVSSRRSIQRRAWLRSSRRPSP